MSFYFGQGKKYCSYNTGCKIKESGLISRFEPLSFLVFVTLHSIYCKQLWASKFSGNIVSEIVRLRNCWFEQSSHVIQRRSKRFERDLVKLSAHGHRHSTRFAGKLVTSFVLFPRSPAIPLALFRPPFWFLVSKRIRRLKFTENVRSTRTFVKTPT